MRIFLNQKRKLKLFLRYIAENEDEYWKSLKDNVNLLFFDEGHREPAKYWRTVIRQFDCKKVLFTATPYRNDKPELFMMI